MPAPTFDLQTALAAMADYPALLRRLGVIRVVEVDLAGTGINPAAGPVTVSAKPVWPTKLPAGQVAVAPVKVPAFLSPSRFALQADGRLDPAAAGIELAEVDTDSAALRLVDLARQLVNAAAANADPPYAALPPVAVPEQMALPSLRNAGLALVQGDRAVDLRSRLELAAPLLSATGSQQLADALQAVKGYVLDVWDDRTGRWHTLCARRGSYRLPGGETFTLDDEGAISLAVTARPDAGSSDTLYLHQSMVRWTGWSLVAPRPGQLVTTESPGREPQAGEPALPDFTVSFTPQPGTLPRLRFGVGYRFQLRTVDVAGRADPLNPASTDFTRAVPAPPAPPARYFRFDPVVAPVLVPSAPMTEGESVETLVVRPEPGLLPGVVSSLLGPILGTPPVRHVAPPKVSELLCEEHGRFDDAHGKPDPARYAMIAARDKADLQTVGDPDPRRPGQRYFDGLALPVSWLSDPLSRGAVIAGLPGGLVKVDFDPALLHSWPDVRSFRLQLADGDGPPFWNPLLRILTVHVPRGETRRARLSSFVDGDELGVLGQLGWLAGSGASAATVAAARADVANGQAWQVTPSKTLTLVNAVRVPLHAPDLMALTPADTTQPRTLGSTKADLTATASVHRPSTGKLTLQATWSDPVDNPADPAGPTSVTATANPALSAGGDPPSPELSIDYDPDPVTGAQVPFAATQVFGDTKRHQVTYSLVGTTRYMEYFTQRGAVTLPAADSVKLSKVGIVPGTDTVRAADGATTYRRDVDYTVDYDEGTIARKAGGAIDPGESVEVALVAPPVSRPSGTGVTVDLPSTARPVPPRVAWIVPSFGWDESSELLGRKRTRIRRGGGLRVFLERGWYSSGVGEQLAVVLSDGPVATGDEQLLALLTQLGADPVVKTEIPGRFPAPADFPMAVGRRGGLSLSELAGRTVAVAAHDVTWDAARQRWACDIVLPPGRVYQPFVHLALARYQPNSLGGVELSAVAPVEWAQLTPDRSATVTLETLDLTKVTVTVAGRSPAGTAGVPNQPNAVSAIIQTASGLTPGDLDWRTVGPADGQRLASTTQPDGTTTWTGTLRLPTVRLLHPYRLVLTEHEQYSGGTRLVYSDVIRL